jgi:protein-arginine kinase activator protein McsA
MFQSRSPDEQIFSLNARIKNLMTSYEMLLKNNEFERAQEVADQIDEVQQQIIAIQSQNVPQMGMGLGQKKN